MQQIEEFINAFSAFVWGIPLLVLLLGGGLFFLFYSGFTPFRYFGHAIAVLRGKYDDATDPGDINHYEALAAALAATIGVGNIGGVATAIATGGPGAIFWMWVSAIVGMATKYFTCTLSIMYRGQDSKGNIQGGPMYVVREGLGRNWMPLANFFCVAGMIGCFPLFQANQLTQIVRDKILLPFSIIQESDIFYSNIISGLVITFFVGLVVLGGIHRIGKVAGKLVPLMVVIYVSCAVFILILYIDQIPASFQLIFTDAFTGKAVLGGAIGSIIIIGVKRAAFSNEAGIGTAPMMHGAAKTKEPVREGLVAMLGPFIDTIVVCTMTALMIIVTGVWQTKADGVTLTANAFDVAMPGIGSYILVLCVFTFAFTTLFSFSYYGSKCFGFLFGAENQHYYNFIYVGSIIFGAVASIDAAIGVIDSMYALMAIPTTLSALWLAPKVKAASLEYFKRMQKK